MTKKLNTSHIINELEESAFFHQAKQEIIQEPPSEGLAEPEKTFLDPVPPVPRTGSTPSTELPVPPVPGVPPIKRIMKQRHPFDIYQDQYHSLQQLAAEERKNGGMGSMSAMVREALDKLIAERTGN